MGQTGTVSVPERSPSVLSSWTRTIVRALEVREVDPAPLLAEAGLDPALLADPNARFPIAVTGTLWCLAAEATGDPAFGLFASRFVEQTTFHALGYAVMASDTLREAFERFARYGRLVSDAGDSTMEVNGDRWVYRLEVPPRRPRPTDESIDAMMSLIARICRVLGGDGLRLFEVTLMREEPTSSDAYSRAFRAPVVFGTETNSLVYPSTSLDTRLPSGNPELARLNEEVVAHHLSRIERDCLGNRVRAWLVGRMASGESRPADAARELGLSVRSLQRRLADEDTSFKQVLADTRCELASAYLRDGRTTVSEVTFLLGFADTSSFARAFRRWTGTSPGEYQKAG